MFCSFRKNKRLEIGQYRFFYPALVSKAKDMKISLKPEKLPAQSESVVILR